jgi:hypothetical protein
MHATMLVPNNPQTHMKNSSLVHKIAAAARPGRSGLWMSALCLLAASAAYRANATDGTWINTSSGGLWSSSANWNGGVIADGEGAVADFSTINITANTTVALDSARTVGGLRFGDTASSFFNWTLGNNGSAANVLTLAGTAPFITVTNNTLTNNLVISGTSGFAVNGGAAVSSLVLAAANTFTGDVSVNAGNYGHLYLYLNNVGALGGSSAASNSVILAPTGSFRSILMLNSNAAGGSYPAYNGVVARPLAATRAEVRCNTGSCTWNGNITLDGVSGLATCTADFYVDANATFTINGNITATNNYMGSIGLRGAYTGIINGTITAPNAFLKKDDGSTWTIASANNSYATNWIANGRMKLGVDNALPASAVLAMGGSGNTYLDLNGYKQTLTSFVVLGSNVKTITNTATGMSVLTVNANSDITCPFTIGGNMNLVKTGSSVLTLTSVSGVSGNTVISNGTLALGSGGGFNASNNIVICPGAKFDASSSGYSLLAKTKLVPMDATSILLGNLSLGSGTLVVNYSNNAPVLTVSGGILTLTTAGSAIVNVPSTIAAGSYLVVAAADGGSVSGVTPATVTLSGVSGLGASFSITDGQLYLNLNSLSVVTAQYPVTYTNLTTMFVGASPTFSVTAGGVGPFGYLWYTNGTLNAAATNSSMTWSNLALGTKTVYCKITNANGSVTSGTWTIAVVAAPIQPYPAGVVAGGALCYWRLNEADNGAGNVGVIANDFMGGNNGIYTNTVFGQTGYNQNTDPTTTSILVGTSSLNNGGALGIMGPDLSSPTNSSKSFSVEAWVNGYQPSTDSGIVAKGYGNGGEQFSLDTGGNSHGFRFFVRDASGGAHVAASSFVPDYGTWHHLAGVCDQVNGKVTLYVDGLSVASASIGTNAGIMTSTAPTTIGTRASSSSTLAANNYDLQFAGNINEVALYGYALSASNVVAHFTSAGIAPIIITNPPASVDANEHSTVRIVAAANGSLPMTYKWFDVNANAYMTEQTNATLVLSNIVASDSYYLTVENTYGTANSSTVAINMISGLNASITPTVGWTSYAGRIQNFTANVTGTEPFAYRWYTNGVTVPNATNATFALAIPLGNVTVNCSVTNSYNGFTSNWLGPVSFTGAAAPTNQYEVAVIADNPLAYWALNEVDNGLGNGNGGVTGYDYVGGHHGVYSNVSLGLEGFDAANFPTITSAGFGLTVTSNSFMRELDNTGAGITNIDFAKATGSGTQFSVEAWYYGTTGDAIVAKGCGHAEQFALDIYSGSFRFVFRNAAASTVNIMGGTFAANQWYHIVGVWDGVNGSERIYVNGAQANSASVSTTLGCYTVPVNSSVPNANLVSIGCRPSWTTTNANDVQTKGKVSNVAIYGYALSSNQVVAHYYNATNIAVVTPGTLAITNLANGQVQLSWAFSGQLQSSTNAAGPYNTITDAVSPYAIPTTNTQMFFRVKQR